MFRQSFRSFVRSIKAIRHTFKKKYHSTNIRALHKAKGNKIPRFSQLRQITRVLSREERMLLRMSLLLFIIGGLWISATVVRGYRVQVPAIGGSYTEAVVGSPELINPLFASLNDADKDIVELVYSGLMRYNKDHVLVPDLAGSIDVNETNTIYTFHLRKDVVWHDEESFTAEDVAFTFETIQNETIGSPLYITFQNVVVEVLDEYTVQFTLDEPFAPFLQSMTVGILPEHYWFDVQPERFSLTQKNIQPVGTGPFMFARLTKDVSGSIYEYELERFDRYYRKSAFIEEFSFEYYSVYDGDAGAIRALRQKSVEGLHFLPSDLRDQADRKHTVLHTLQLPQYTALFFNSVREPALNDKDVRQALTISLDKERILREAVRGEGKVIEGPLLPEFPGYVSDIERASYDIDAANKLLDEKWKPLTTEEYRNLRKKELTEQLIVEAQERLEKEQVTATSTSSTIDSTEENNLQITVTSSTVAAEVEQILAGEIDPAQTIYRKSDDDVILDIDIVTVDTAEYRDAAALIESTWQEIGITVSVAFIPAKDFSRTVLKDRSYDVLLYGVIVGDDPDQYPFWHSSQIASPGLNLALYKNEKIDTILESARSVTDEAKQAALYTEFQTILLEDMPAIFLYTPTYTYAQTEDVYGFDVSQIYVPSDRFANVTEWYLKTKGIWKKTQKNN